jgi:tetratricopeptide (TPR) repeat protein
MTTKKWTSFPHDAKAFQYKGKALATHWARLHRGDCEPLPTAANLQEAWRAYHCGDFRRAYDLGTELGLPGFAVAIKAAGVYASYLEKNEHHAQELLLAASERAAEAIKQLPKEPNAHYLFAYTLGRYSQRISIVEALARGLAPKIEHALQQALKLEPKHADANIALGLYHAEIIGKLGSLAGGLSYGASSSKAVEHFKQAIKLNPDAAIAKLEYAHGLRLIDGDDNADEIDKLLHQAAKCKPVDAMEMLDVERAKELLEEA